MRVRERGWSKEERAVINPKKSAGNNSHRARSAFEPPSPDRLESLRTGGAITGKFVYPPERCDL